MTERYKSAVYLNMPSSTAGLADEWLTRNFKSCDLYDAAWRCDHTGAQERDIYSKGRFCVRVGFVNDDILRKFVLWCEFNPVEIFSIERACDASYDYNEYAQVR